MHQNSCLWCYRIGMLTVAAYSMCGAVMAGVQVMNRDE